MIRKHLRLLSVPLLATALWAAACSESGSPIGPQDGPAFNTQDGTSQGSYRKLKGTDGSGQSVSATIGRAGGTLTLGQHTINVPKDAVTQNTVFTITSKDADFLTVDLTAVAYDKKGNVIWTGEQGFQKPVRLALSFSQAAESFDVSTVRIAWWKADGTYEIRPTSVNASGMIVTTDLSHFSDYALAIPF